MGAGQKKGSRRPQWPGFRAFARDSRGATALEFALIAPLFFIMLFAIFECCITFAAKQVMTNATDDLARQMRTGKIRGDELTAAQLHDLICDRMPAFFAAGCPGLKVDLRNFDTFEEISLEFQGGVVPESFVVDLGPALSKNVMRVFYEWPGVLSFMSDRLADPRTGKTLLFTTATWQNEPFDS